jgi:hypothetical protein
MFQHEAKYQLALFIGPAIFAVWAGLFLPHFGAYGLLAVSLAAIGFGFILVAKFSEKKITKKNVSCGSEKMTIREKISYFIGFLMIAAYLVLSICLSIYPLIDEAGNL